MSTPKANSSRILFTTALLSYVCISSIYFEPKPPKQSGVRPYVPLTQRRSVLTSKIREEMIEEGDQDEESGAVLP